MKYVLISCGILTLLITSAIAQQTDAQHQTTEQSQRAQQLLQPIPAKSYDEWALHQEINCRSALATIWRQANQLEDAYKNVLEENEKLKRAQHVPDIPATN